VRAAAAAWLLPLAAAGADDVYVSGQLERISASGVGGGGGVEWVRAGSPRTLRLGLSAFGLPDTRWQLARAGASVSYGRTSLAADLMGGHSNVEGGFFQVRGGATHPLQPARILGDVECQYLGGMAAHGTLAKAGLTFLPRTTLVFQGGYFESIGGTLGTHLGVVKATYIAGRRRYLAGASVGRSSPSVLGLSDDQVAQDIRHVFAGATLPIAAQGELTIVLEHYDLDVANRSILSLIWKVGHRPKGR
jgi:hypothetical protein